ncbi:unnamed protein product [Polarella glacialis]|uniref:Uncharacterized protein n=1 Tax=Polarella glacialis TaxID=89957 RepID=A0A813INW1_POLGL|nr:unnamed protein product [Polarella glacialis]
MTWPRRLSPCPQSRPGLSLSRLSPPQVRRPVALLFYFYDSLGATKDDSSLVFFQEQRSRYEGSGDFFSPRRWGLCRLRILLAGGIFEVVVVVGVVIIGCC